MKRLVLLLLLSSLALADCTALVTQAEQGREGLVALDSVDCDAQGTKGFYSGLAALAEDYMLAAQCYEGQSEDAPATAFYFYAAEKYALAGDALCSSDYSLKMGLYLSSGDAYLAAGDRGRARGSFEKAEQLYSLHSSKIDNSLNAELQRRLHELDYPVNPQQAFRPDASEEADWAPIAAALVLVAGLALVGITIVRKR